MSPIQHLRDIETLCSSTLAYESVDFDAKQRRSDRDVDPTFVFLLLLTTKTTISTFKKPQNNSLLSFQRHDAPSTSADADFFFDTLAVSRPGPSMRLLRLRPGRRGPLPRALGLWQIQHLLRRRPRFRRGRLRLRRRLLGRGQLRRVERGQAGAGRAGDPEHPLRQGAQGPFLWDCLPDDQEQQQQRQRRS